MALHIQKILEFHQSPHAKSETCEKSPNGTVEVGRDDILLDRNLSRKHRTGPRTTTRPSIQRNTSLSMTRGTSGSLASNCAILMGFCWAVIAADGREHLSRQARVHRRVA